MHHSEAKLRVHGSFNLNLASVMAFQSVAELRNPERVLGG